MILQRDQDVAPPIARPPFRVGTTSYIYPADVLPNVEKLVRWVDDIEIVLYEVTPISPLPDARTLDLVRELGCAYDTTYTVHLPLDLALASADTEARTASLNLARRVIRRAHTLDPWGYVVHVEHQDSWPGSWARWRHQSKESLQRLTDEVEDPKTLCLENTESTPPDEVFCLADELGLGVCLDVGHLFKAGTDPVPYLDGRLSSSRIVHLHGWNGDRDHRSLRGMRQETIEPVIERLCHPPYGGVVTLEVFSKEALQSSWEFLVGVES